MKQGPAGVTPPALDNRTVLSVRKTNYFTYTSVKHRVLRVIMRNIRASFFAVTFLSLVGEIYKTNNNNNPSWSMQVSIPQHQNLL